MVLFSHTLLRQVKAADTVAILEQNKWLVSLLLSLLNPVERSGCLPLFSLSDKRHVSHHYGSVNEGWRLDLPADVFTPVFNDQDDLKMC